MISSLYRLSLALAAAVFLFLSCSQPMGNKFADPKFSACLSSSTQGNSVFALALKVTCAFGSTDIAAPVISASPNGGVYGSSVNVNFVGNEGATVYYTVDGTKPTLASSSFTVNPTLGYNTALTIVATTNLRYFSVDAAGNTSDEKLASFTVEANKNQFAITDVKTFFNDIVSNSVSDNSSVAISFTASKNGSVEVRATRGNLVGSTLIKTETYNGGTFTTTVAGTALEPGLNNIFLVFTTEEANGYAVVEVNKDEVYPITLPSVEEGAYNTSQSIQLVANEGSKIWYCNNDIVNNVNPMDPHALAKQGPHPGGNDCGRYSAAIFMNADLALKYYAVDYAGNMTDVDYVSAYNFDGTGPEFINPITSANPGARVTTVSQINDNPAGAATMMSTGAGTTTATIQVRIKDQDDANTNLPETDVLWYQFEISTSNCNLGVHGAGTLIGSRVNVNAPDITYSIANTNALTITLAQINEGLNYVCLFASDAAGNVSTQMFLFLKDSTVKTPVPVYPATGQKIKSGTIRFKWTNLEPSETLLPIPVGSGEKRYELQIDTNVGFTTSPDAAKVLNYVLDVSSQGLASNYYYDASSALFTPGSRYYYRVRFTDGANNVSNWSAAIPFYFGKVENDIDGDGFSDVAIGASTRANGGTQRGSVYVYFGNDGYAAPSITINNNTTDRHAFGRSIDIIDDIDNNGYADLIVGASDDNGAAVAPGRAYVYLNIYNNASLCNSTIPCTLNHSQASFYVDGMATGDKLGTVVKDLGDLNSDGFSDYGVTAPDINSPGGNKSGRLYIFLGSASPVLGSTDPATAANYVINGAATNAALGSSLAFGGDLNRDGYHDLIVGSPFLNYSSMSNAGAVYVIMGKTTALTVSYSYYGEAASEKFGSYISGGADINADGYDDFAVSAPEKTAGFTNEGHYRYFIGGDDVPVIDYYPVQTMPVGGVANSGENSTIAGGFNNALFATSGAMVRNPSGNGLSYLFGCTTTYTQGANTNAGQCRMYSTGALNLLGLTLEGTAVSEFYGHAFKSIGDINGDGLADFAVSDVNLNNGRVRLYQGNSTVTNIVVNATITGVSSGDKFGFSLSGE